MVVSTGLLTDLLKLKLHAESAREENEIFDFKKLVKNSKVVNLRVS